MRPGVKLGVLWAALALLAASLVAYPGLGAPAWHLAKRVAQKMADLVDPPPTVAEFHDRLADASTAVVVGPADIGEDGTLVVFVDYNCVHCRRQFAAFDALAAQGRRFRVVVRHLPHTLDSIALAQAMLAARLQGKGEALHHALAAAIDPLTPGDLPALAAAAGLDPERLLADAATPEVEALLDADIRMAAALRIRSTPTLVAAGERAQLQRGVQSPEQLAVLLRQ